MTSTILGIGTANPEHSMSQTESAQLASEVFTMDERQQRVLNVLYKKAGVQNRQTVLPHRIATQWLPGEEASESDVITASTLGPSTSERMEFYNAAAPELALEAARHAIEQSRVAPDSITHLVTVSCTGFGAPGFDIELIERLPLSPTTQRAHIGFMGCHGAVNGMRVAQSLAESNPGSKVLLVATECCSLHYRFQYEPDLIMGNALFGDGAAALVIGNTQTPPTDEESNDSPLAHLAATGCCLIPDSKDAMSWTVGDHGFEMFISAQVPNLIEANLRPWLEKWLGEQGLAMEDVCGWAIHPGGPRILSSVQESLELTGDDLACSRSILSEFGNMSSPTILFILQRMLSQRGNDALPCVAIGFGPGLMAEVALFR